MQDGFPHHQRSRRLRPARRAQALRTGDRRGDSRQQGDGQVAVSTSRTGPLGAFVTRPAGMTAADPPPIVGGSQDDLLEWTLRESGSGLASLAEGTARGVERLLRGEVIATAVHFHSDTADKA